MFTDFQNYLLPESGENSNNTLTKDPKCVLKCVATLPYEMSSVLKATIENKMTSVTTHFKKLTTGNNVFSVSVIVKVTVTSCSFYIKCWMFNVSALLLDDALKPATPLTNGAINETLRHTLDISQGSVATYVRCSGILIVIVLSQILSRFW